MLTLTRKPGEWLQVGEAWVMPTYERGKIKLHVVAPPHVKVYREEVSPHPLPKECEKEVGK